MLFIVHANCFLHDHRVVWCIRARGIILPASARKQTKTGHVQNCHTVSHGLINNFSVFEDNDVIFGVARDITAYD